MSKLSEFLRDNSDIATKEVEVAISPRFVDKDGNLLKFKIRPMTNDEFSAYQKKCTSININGRKRETSFDGGKFNSLVIINQCLDPDFKDANFIKELGVMTPEQAINKVLLAGEIVELSNQITSISGFDVDINDKIEEAKN